MKTPKEIIKDREEGAKEHLAYLMQRQTETVTELETIDNKISDTGKHIEQLKEAYKVLDSYY